MNPSKTHKVKHSIPHTVFMNKGGGGYTGPRQSSCFALNEKLFHFPMNINYCKTVSNLVSPSNDIKMCISM